MENKPSCVLLDKESLRPEDLNFSELSSISRLTEYAQTRPEELLSRCDNSEIIITNKVVITSEHLEQLKHLKLVCVIATGTNNVDLKAAADLGIPVCNVKNYGAASVGQHVMMLMLSLSTHYNAYQKAIRNGRWQSQDQFCLLDYPMSELQGKTLGLIGYGHIAQQVEKLALAFGMNVVIAQSLNPQSRADANRLNLQQLLPQVDFLSLHCPLSDRSLNLINSQSFSQMKKTACIINTARGGIINEQDLVDALESGEIAGAGIDCLTEEPPSEQHVLLQCQHPNLIITPHNAWGTKEARQRLVDGTVSNIKHFISNRPLETVNNVNRA